MFKPVLLFSILFVFSTQSLSAQQITRGPYLQMGTPNSMTIRWRTDIPVTGKVQYGADLANLLNEATGNSPVTEHEIKITGLLPATVYYYNIGTANAVILPAQSGMYFKTSPLPGTSAPYRFWVIGDFGDGSQGQLAVRDAYASYTGAVHTDAWVWLGDNAYGSGTQQEFQNYVFNIYPGQFKKMVAWPCPGNHDYGSVDLSNNGPYYDIFTMPVNGEAGGVPSGKEGYYSFDYGNVHFISLNSEYLPWTLLANTEMTAWLRNDLENNDKDWTVAYWHQPPYSKGSHDSDEAFSRMSMMRANINPILEEFGVDLVLCGHSHAYERSHLMKGHYGASTTFNRAEMVIDSVSPFVKYLDGDKPNTGTVYAVVGCSGKLSASGNLNHPAMAFSTKSHHGSLVIDVNGYTFNAKFLTSSGAIADEFTILKMSENATTGIHNPDAPMKIYPNPANKYFGVRFSAAWGENSKLSLYDVKGKEVAALYAGSIPAGEVKTFSTAQFAPGLYLLTLVAGEKTRTAKLLIER